MDQLHTASERGRGRVLVNAAVIFLGCEEWCLLGCYAVWLLNPEDTILHSHRRENLKSYFLGCIVFYQVTKQLVRWTEVCGIYGLTMETTVRFACLMAVTGDYSEVCVFFGLWPNYGDYSEVCVFFGLWPNYGDYSEVCVFFGLTMETTVRSACFLA
jgi:hypothetical protein